MILKERSIHWEWWNWNYQWISLTIRARDDNHTLEWAEKNGSQHQRGKYANTLEITNSGKFKHDYRLIQKRGYDKELLRDVVEMLKTGEPLDEKNHDHKLIADCAGSRECHIRPDWLLIYRKGKDYIELQRTGTHSDLFWELSLLIRADEKIIGWNEQRRS